MQPGRRHFLVATVVSVTCLLVLTELAAQEPPRGFIAPQARGIDPETHVDLLVGAEEAQNHVNKTIMVCGVVKQTYFELRDDNLGLGIGPLAGFRNTYLYFDKPRGEHDFVAIVRGSVRKDLAARPESLTDEKVCVFGKVVWYRGRAAIRIKKPGQIAAVKLGSKTWGEVWGSGGEGSE